jgi:serine/threonine-protein kinase
VQTGHPTTVLAGRYALLEELGRSGTGMAWRAEDRLLARTVTVKLIHPSLADDDVFAARLAEQARLVASVGDPGIARLLDTGEEDGVAYLVREHVVGTSVREILRERGPLPPPEAGRIGRAVLDALAPAHEAGVLHLHLGLDDVLVVADGRVKITDLGIGPAVAATLPPDEALRLLGGAEPAPEQVRGAAVDARADLHAVGALLFEMLTGEAPRGRREPRRVRAIVPRALDRVVARALAPDAADRYPSAPAFASDLRAAAVDDGARPTSRRRWLGAWLGVPLAIVAVAAAVIVAGLLMGPLELGGPVGIRPAEEPASTPEPAVAASPRSFRPVAVTVLDPFGTGGENDDAASFTLDGDLATAWRSENYFDDTLNNKPGVGLLFDLEQSREVVGFLLSAPNPGYEFHVAVGDDPDSLIDEIGPAQVAEVETAGTIVGSGRYVLVWITSVVPTPDGNRAEIAEFSVSIDA